MYPICRLQNNLRNRNWKLCWIRQDFKPEQDLGNNHFNFIHGKLLSNAVPEGGERERGPEELWMILFTYLLIVCLSF